MATAIPISFFKNTSSGQVSVWEMNGNTPIGGGTVSLNPGMGGKAIGTGDFNGDGHSDILFQDTTTGQVSIWEMDGTNLIAGGPVSPNPGTSCLDLGNEREHSRGRRTRHPKSRVELASRRLT
jgi:hypothetical protein